MQILMRAAAASGLLAGLGDFDIWALMTLRYEAWLYMHAIACLHLIITRQYCACGELGQYHGLCVCIFLCHCSC